MSTRTATFQMIGIAPYSQSKAHDTPKIDDKEGHDEFDKRTWREKAHYDKATGEVAIPAMALKMAIAEAAKRLSIKIPGKRGATYSKNILSGVLVLGDIPIGVRIDDLQAETIYANADGVRGSGKRVFRRFPVIPKGWKGTAQVAILDSEIPQDVIERCLHEAGNLIGIGRFRPEKGGFLGRFDVKSIKWQTAKAAA